ncbi:MAG: ATP-binding protein [Bacillota bacterium]|nr:ATP-binding protein [Bacillota bacterium]
MKKSKPVIYSIFSFLLIFLIGMGLYREWFIQTLDIHKDADNEILYSTTGSIERKISICKSASKALATTIEVYGRAENFQELAAAVMNKYEGMYRVQLLQNGKIVDVYPFQENKDMLNYDVNSGIPKENVKVYLSDKKTYLSGPVKTKAGWYGFVVRTSVFLKDGQTGKESFWGSVCVLIKIDEFVNQLNLDKLKSKGYEYELYQVKNSTKEKFIIAKSSDKDISDGISKNIKYDFGNWTLTIRNNNEVHIMKENKINITGIFIISILAGILTFFITRQRQRLLEEAEKNIQRLKEAKEYDTLKTEFFANLSHEFRTPINIILSAIKMIEIYLDKTPSSVDNINKIIKYKDITKKNCYRLLRIIGNLIDVTKMDVGFLQLNLVNTNIVSLVENITLSVIEYSESKSVELIFDTDVEEKYTLCDPDKIERIMLNLLSNAIKFTNSGDKIQVTMYDKGNLIEVSIKDTGIGIPKDKQISIFDRFIQVNKGFNRDHEGSGIGLSLVKSLVELHGGNIKLNSNLTKGSEFIFTLPIKSTEVESIQSEEGNLDGNNENYRNLVETIQIEFSDIY